MTEYKKYIESLTKEELVDLIVGTEDIAPLLTRDEPTYSRPQITWGINKLNKERKVGLEYTQDDVLKILNYIERMSYENFYIYNYFTFELRKPSILVVILILCLSLVGFIFVADMFINLVFLVYGFLKIT